MVRAFSRLSFQFLLGFVLFNSFATANVNLRNGNFFIGYTDIVYPGGFEPKIDRVYNSKTNYKGYFGWGWGTEYEVYLTVSADGSVVIHEYGGGAENRFYPKKFESQQLETGVKQISDIAKKMGQLSGADQVKAYEAKLRTDAQFRNDEWEKFLKAGRLKAVDLKAGVKLYSNRFSFQFVTKLANGYQRSFDNGRVEFFDRQGRIIKIQDKNNNFVELAYGNDGKLEKIQDNFNRRINFKFNNKGLIERIDGENKKEATYRYNDKDDLTASKDVDNNTYEYQYDRWHNVTEIHYTDKTKMKMEYYDRDQNQNVKSVTDRDGTKTEYKYSEKAGEVDRFAIGVVVKDKKSKTISDSLYDYEMKSKPTGEKWTYRLTTVIDGDRTETTYNECCGLPIAIKKGTELTKFKYDDKGRVLEKDSPAEFTQLQYQPQFGKVTYVSKLEKRNKKKDWSKFKYDGKGNLTYAENSKKQRVGLVYDRYGRISLMTDHGKRRISFKYNNNSKPIEISDPDLGAIRVSYKNSGEIDKVESTAGRKIALQVTSAFQNLLDIVRPAGVNLGFF